jgi:hypothetical protein
MVDPERLLPDAELPHRDGFRLLNVNAPVAAQQLNS